MKRIVSTGSAGRRAVVGVDGSRASHRALRWAVDWAAAGGGGTVDAVNVWSIPYAYSPAAIGMLASDTTGFTDEAERTLKEAVAELEPLPQAVSVVPIVEEGQPAGRLLRRAEGADLLVVGSRGLGGFRGLLLGSTSQQCLHHAPCPVLVVPAPPEGASGGDES